MTQGPRTHLSSSFRPGGGLLLLLTISLDPATLNKFLVSDTWVSGGEAVITGAGVRQLVPFNRKGLGPQDVAD